MLVEEFKERLFRKLAEDEWHRIAFCFLRLEVEPSSLKKTSKNASQIRRIEWLYSSVVPIGLMGAELVALEPDGFVHSFGCDLHDLPFLLNDYLAKLASEGGVVWKRHALVELALKKYKEEARRDGFFVLGDDAIMVGAYPSNFELDCRKEDCE